MTEQQGGKQFAAKKSVSELGRSISDHADRVADIIIDDSRRVKGAKSKEVTREALHLFKDLRRQFRAGARDLLIDAAYGIGKISGTIKRACSYLLNYLRGNSHAK